MPIYEYRCQACGHLLDALQKVSDVPLTDCPECRASALQKQLTAAGFRLKGKGWYETDFKSGNPRNLAGDKKAPEQKSETSDSKKTTGKDSKDKISKKSTSPASAAH